MTWPFFANQGTKYLILYAVAYLCGLLVLHKGVKVNYTRKINHFFLFLLPVFLDRQLNYDKTALASLITSAFVVGSFALYIKPIRERIPFVGTMFSSFDRPEDRPHTLFWITSQMVVSYLIIFGIIYAFNEQGIGGLVYIPLLINGIGDGLAEPVGVRFGKHKYQVRGFFTDRVFTRSLEGSACVFLTSVIVLLLFQAKFSQEQLIAALLIIPITMTLAEAWSPHTWDSPLLFLVGGLSTVSVFYFF